MTDFDSVRIGSTPIVVTVVMAELVNAPDCGSGYPGSIPGSHPKNAG